MRLRAIELASWLAALLGVVSCLLSGCSRAETRPNVVLVSVDTLRADHLSCYESEGPVATPSFDRVASEGVLFEHATSVGPNTLPAHASLLTALLPPTHQVRDNVGFRLREDVPTLATTLKSHGYRTGGFVGAFVLDHAFGLGRGFDRYSDETADSGQELRERRGEVVLDDALTWIGEGGEPFFAFLHFFDPHRPYDPPPPFRPDDPEPPSKVDEAESRQHALYRGEVAYVDSLVGRLLEFLDQRGLADSTILVVTADHGESLGEHGEETHSFFLYQSTLHIPLLIRGPSVPAGRRVPDRVRTIDVAPTVLELAGLEAPPGMEGRSLLSVSGELLAQPDLEAYSETFVPRLHYGWSELRSLTSGKWKLILAPRSELYDLDSDPGETRNLAEAEPSVTSDLREKILALQQDETVRAEALDPTTLRSLQALGYLGGGSSGDPDRSFAELPDPKDELSIYNEILSLSVAEPSDETLARWSAVLRADPANPRALQLYGNALLDRRRAREALEVFARIPGESFEAFYGAGRAHLELGENAAAKASLERASALDPTDGNVLQRLAALDKLEGNQKAAEGKLRQAIEISPNRSLYQDLAELLLASGRESELARLAESWSGSGAEEARAYARGRLLVSQGQPQGALVELEHAFGLAPDDDNVEQALANVLSQLRRFEEAKVHYRAILDRNPCYLGALTNLGAVNEQLGMDEEAARRYQAAIDCEPTYAVAYKNLGSLLARKGDLRRALGVLRTAQHLSPGEPELAEAIAELERMVK